jgi:hypothetical protein
MVDNNMMTALDRPFFSTRQCLIVPKEDGPMCVKIGEQHVIFLTAKDNYWCQWVYQFAHEYCHHLIDGSLSGDWSDMLWFEETVCELSSLYNLNKMADFCETNGLNWYVTHVKDYLNDLLNNNHYVLSTKGGWYKEYESSLREIEYPRDLYNAMAVLMYSLFLENPNLWKLILNIGDIRKWSTIDDLFSHLRASADSTYSESLSKLIMMFS